jgi:hypothetical protein
VATASLILQILLIGGIIAASLFLKNFLPSYVTEKGRNLATKQDIAAITKEVESVKAFYTREIEHLRSSLTVLANQRSAFDEQRRKALFQFFDDCVALTFDRLTANHGDFPADQGQAITKYQEETMVLFTAIILDYHRVLLLCEERSELTLSAQKVVMSSIDVRRAFRQHFTRVKLRMIDEARASGSDDKEAYKRAVQAANEAEATYRNALKPHQESMHNHFAAFLRALNTYIHTQDDPVTPQLLEESIT